MNRGTYLTQIATAVPSFRYSQAELAKWMAKRLRPNDERLERKLGVLYHRTKIENRYSVLPDFDESNGEAKLFKAEQKTEPKVELRMQLYQKHAKSLCKSAIKKLLAEDELATISHLITVSCTGLSAPGLELQLKEDLPFSDALETHGVNFIGCYAFFPALKMARAFCAQDGNAKVLIVAVELCTLHFQNQETDDHLLSNSLFADGAAACLVEGEETYRKHNKPALSVQNMAQLHLPNGKQDMAWDIHSSGFLMKLSSYIPNLVDHGIKQLIQKLNQKQQHQIDQWAIHPGGRKILEVCQKELQLSDDDLSASYEVLRGYGNLSAPTIMFVLHELWQKAEKGKQVFACGFGPGLTLDGAVLKWTEDA
ncbi:MAG: type III polyketide synthase [Vicingaceae bacterium]